MSLTACISRGASTCRILIAGALVALSVSAAGAHEGDHWPISGGSLKMGWSSNGSKTKLVFKAKNQININPVSIANDPTVERSTLIVRGTGAVPGNSGLIDLDPARWSPIGDPLDPKGWKFQGSEFYSLGITKVQLKAGNNDGSIIIQAKGFYWPFEIQSSQDSIEIVLTIGEFAYCAEYSADRMAEFKTNEAGSIKATFSLAPGDCPQICGNGIIETGEQCDDGNEVDGDTCNNQCEGCNPADAEFSSTYEGIQELIFDNNVYNCLGCHGATLEEGGLDLRAENSYLELLGPDQLGEPSEIHPPTVRVFAGDQDKSMLYKKLAAKTLGTSVEGSAMPVGPDELKLTEEHLEAIRLWIRGGAPETGVVAGTAELLGSCLPAPTPLDIPQPAAPDPSAGTQFAMPGYNLQSEDEIEGCVASYYDVAATVPPEMIVDCPYICDPYSTTNLVGQICDPMAVSPCGTNGDCVRMFAGTNPGGQCFSYAGNELYQDGQSHHSIVHIYPGEYDWNDPGWGAWRCYGGPTPNAGCSPAVANSCGEGGVCGGLFHPGVACLDLFTADWGAPDFDTSTSPQFSGAQESTADFNLPTGVYGLLPLKGLIVWNSHAFNLTSQDTEMEAWINISYTDQRTWPARGLFANQWIFTQNVPVFEQREYCATHTFDEGTRLFQLSSHTHKRGIRWRYYAPPQTPCSAPGSNTSPSCLPGDIGDLFYESYDYSDPLTLNPEPPIHYTGSVEDRTIKFCSLYDNGFLDPDDVKLQSTSPTGTGLSLFGGPCGSSTVACLDGTNQGGLCHNNDAECPGSALSHPCDACPLRGGVTTEDEMYIAIGTFYIDP